MRELAGVSPEDCENPIIFAVTNFDASEAGEPNFVDWPKEAHANPPIDGMPVEAPWGMERERSTTITRSRPSSAVCR